MQTENNIVFKLLSHKCTADVAGIILFFTTGCSYKECKVCKKTRIMHCKQRFEYECFDECKGTNKFW